MKDSIIFVLGVAFCLALGIAKYSYMTDMCERHGGTFSNGMCLGSTATYQAIKQ